MGSNGFVRKKVSSLTLGEKIRKLREDRMMSVRDVSRSTGIRSLYLEYLEAGQYNKLPADVYVRGFLRSFAEVFSLSDESLVRQYERERNIQAREESPARETKAQKLLFSRRKELSSIILTPKILAAAMVLLSVFGSVVYLYREFSNFVSEPELTVFEPSDGSKIEGLEVAVRGQSESDAVVRINGEEILVDEDGKFEERLSVRGGFNTIIVEAENLFGKVSKDELRIESLHQSQGLVAGAGTTLPKELEVLSAQFIIRAEQEPTWIKVVADGESVFSDILDVNGELQYTVADTLSVSTGNGANTRVIMNGTDFGLLSDAERMVREKVYSVSELMGLEDAKKEKEEVDGGGE